MDPTQRLPPLSLYEISYAAAHHCSLLKCLPDDKYVGNSHRCTIRDISFSALHISRAFHRFMVDVSVRFGAFGSGQF